jgi:hypothetical protein
MRANVADGKMRVIYFPASSAVVSSAALRRLLSKKTYSSRTPIDTKQRAIYRWAPGKKLVRNICYLYPYRDLCVGVLTDALRTRIFKTLCLVAPSDRALWFFEIELPQSFASEFSCKVLW